MLKEFLDIQVQLQDIEKKLYCQCYQNARLRELQEEFIDNQSQSRMF